VYELCIQKSSKITPKKIFFPIGEEIWSYEKLAFIENWKSLFTTSVWENKYLEILKPQ